MNTLRYLKRIGIDALRAPDWAFLAELQQFHMLHVPFENLDIGRGSEIHLDPAHLFEKIVVQRRGGFCYELNTLFGLLLRELGFDVTLVSARVYNDHGLLGPEFDHMALIVQLDRLFLVDVGFGNSFRKPLRLHDGIVRDISGDYWLEPLADNGDRFTLFQDQNGEKKPQYDFSTVPRDLGDYAEMCRYHQSSSDSMFTRKQICTIATPNGRVSLTNDFLTVTEGTKQRKFEIHSPEEFNQILKVHFGIVLEDGAG
jgi:N-hydroxyarylamine O-acetyltransferase